MIESFNNLPEILRAVFWGGIFCLIVSLITIIIAGREEGGIKAAGLLMIAFGVLVGWFVGALAMKPMMDGTRDDLDSDPPLHVAYCWGNCTHVRVFWSKPLNLRPEDLDPNFTLSADTKPGQCYVEYIDVPGYYSADCPMEDPRIVNPFTGDIGGSRDAWTVPEQIGGCTIVQKLTQDNVLLGEVRFPEGCVP